MLVAISKYSGKLIVSHLLPAYTLEMRENKFVMLLVLSLVFSGVTFEANAANQDPVLAKITSRIKELPLMKVNAEASAIKWIVSPKAPRGYKEALQEQHQKLANYFPSLYKWDGTALAIIGDPFTWSLPADALSTDCLRRFDAITAEWKVLPNLQQRLLAGTSYCDGHLIVIFRPDPSNPTPDRDLMAQELGGEIQENARYGNPNIASLDHGVLAIPAWYLQGGQSALSFQLYIAEKRTLSGAPSKVYFSPECLTVALEKLEPSTNGKLWNCLYTRGFAAVELMYALYGWDATTRWFSGYSDPADYKGAFKKAYGDSLSSFNKLADSYWKSLVNKKYVPNDVISRLKKS